jgi:hypothetical protein
MSNAKIAALLAGAKAQAQREYLEPGKYRLEVQAIRARDGFKGLSAIAELKVVKSESTGQGTPSPIDRTVSYVEVPIDTGKKGAAASGRFKAFLMKLVGVASEAELGESAIADFIDERQPGAFLLIDCEAWPKVLPPDPVRGLAGKTITSYRWHTVREEEQPDGAALNAKRTAAKLPALG